MDVGSGLILVVNAGSATLKLSLVDDEERDEVLPSLADATERGVVAVGHRVVHGGTRFREPAVIGKAVEDAIRELEAIAPLHNAPALAGLARTRELLPDIPHVAVFDTAFHGSLPESATVYALPRRWREEWGVRRFGFHGTSVAWSTERTGELLGRDARELSLVVCHLGGGSSVTAVARGRSVDTTMGFTPLEGPPMSTRSGSVDPGALLYVLRARGVTVDELDHALNVESGLKGLSGASGDEREIELAAPDDAYARLALDVYVHRIAAAVAAMTASLDTLDALVFTAGVGEHSSMVREAVCRRLGLLGVEVDPAANVGATPDAEISTPGSRVHVLVIAAREAVVIAREARRILGEDRAGPRQPTGSGSGDAGQ